MKKLLMVSHAFPPRGGSGVQRTLKFAKYLPETGWLPIVLAGRGGYGGYREERDPTLLEEFPAEGRIYRARVVDLLQPLRGLWGRGASSGRALPPKAGARHSRADRAGDAARQLWRTWAYIPDEHIGWLMPAVRQAVTVLRGHGIQGIYSTSDPYTNHLVGLVLACVTGKPWVADFRDPWTLNAHYPHRNSARRHVDSWLQRRFVTKASIVTVTSDRTADQFRAQHSHVEPDKIVTITNGFDEDDFAALKPRPRLKDQREFTLVYAGRFAGDKNASPWFLGALASLLRAHPPLRDRIVVWLVGLVGHEALALLEKLGLAGIVRCTGYLPHRDALAYLLDADVLLLTLSPAPGNEVVILGKTFEYLAARKPILAMVPEGATAQLVRETGSGIVVPPDDVTAIKNALFHIYTRHKQGRLGLTFQVSLEQFTRKHLTTRLAKLLDDLVQ